MRSFVRCTACVLLALAGVASTLAAAPFADAEQRPPNVVIIFADDLGYGDVGCFGSTTNPTPHLDGLAAEGTRFTSFYVGQAVCTASRAALLTGCYPNRVGMAGALNHTSPTGIHRQERLLSELLKNSGYATAAVGEIVAALDRNGLSEETLVVFASDNGPFLSYGNHAGSAAPFREGKLTAFEGGMRVPCIMRWPSHVPAGRVTDEIVSTLDLFTTIVNLAGGDMPSQKTNGLDLRPLLLGAAGSKGRDAFFFYSGDELHAVRSGA